MEIKFTPEVKVVTSATVTFTVSAEQAAVIRAACGNLLINGNFANLSNENYRFYAELDKLARAQNIPDYDVDNSGFLCRKGE